MRSTAIAISLAMLAACRGEPVPRDYRNAPPAMTHPATSSAQTPTAHGMPGAGPETASGAEGKTTQPVAPPADAPKTPVPTTTELPPNAVTSTAANSTLGTTTRKP